MLFSSQAYRESFFELFKLDFRSKYNGSALGFLWSFLKPLFIILILYIVFSKFAVLSIKNFPMYLIAGVLIWNFFATTVTRSLEVFVAKKELLKKTGVPKKILVQSIVASEFLTFIIYVCILSGFAWYFGHTSLTSFFIVLPLSELLIITYGFSLGLSVLYVRFRDLRHIVDVLLQLGFFLSPIFYSIEIIPDFFRSLYLLNPFARLIIEFRQELLYNSLPTLIFVIMSIIISFLFLIVGYLVFNSFKNKIVEDL